MFPNEGGQEHLVRDTKGQRDSREKDCYRAESERDCLEGPKLFSEM
jgi:hypothetical protein